MEKQRPVKTMALHLKERKLFLLFSANVNANITNLIDINPGRPDQSLPLARIRCLKQIGVECLGG